MAELTFTFNVGSRNRVFNVHKDVLIRNCKLFAVLEPMTWDERDTVWAGLNAGIRKGADNELYLPSTDPDIFQRLMDFLYRGTIRDLSRDLSIERKLYWLADIMGAHELMNCLMDSLQSHLFHTDTHFFPSDTKWILQELDGSPLSWLVLSGIACRHLWGHFTSREFACLEDILLQYPGASENLYQVIADHGENIDQRGADYRSPSPDAALGFTSCQFHCHPTGSVCHLTKNYGRDLPLKLGRHTVHEPEIKFEVDESSNWGDWGAVRPRSRLNIIHATAYIASRRKLRPATILDRRADRMRLASRVVRRPGIKKGRSLQSRITIPFDKRISRPVIKPEQDTEDVDLDM